MNTYDTSSVNTGALTGIILSSVIFSLIAIVFAVIIYWRIFAKAGYSGAMGLLMFVPIANIIVLCILAFGTWPIYKELNYLRQQVAQGQQNAAHPQQYQPSSPAAYPQQYPSSPQYPQYGQPQQYGQQQPGEQPQPPQNG
jgi:heme/copper-type cytochrome/quinol oxidase subunit 2